MSARRNRSITLFSDIFHNTPCLTLDQLTAYAGNRISAQERIEIEKHLLDCALCSDALEGLELFGNKDSIKEQVEVLNKEIHNYSISRRSHRINRKFYCSFAALFVLALVSVIYLLNKKPSYEPLFAEYFRPYPNMIPLVRGEESAGKLESAMIEYERENYKECLRILNNLLDRKPDNDTVNFYIGISSLCLNDPTSAISYLQKVTDNKKSDLIDQAAWYIGLAYLKEKKIEAAKASFNKLCSKDGDFKQKSIAIVNLLK
jgi:tetratricopeptide (TPR) repeat protein